MYRSPPTGGAVRSAALGARSFSLRWTSVLFHGFGFRVGERQPVAELRGPIDRRDGGDVERALEIGASIRRAGDSGRFGRPRRTLRGGPVRSDPGDGGCRDETSNQTS